MKSYNWLIDTQEEKIKTYEKAKKTINELEIKLKYEELTSKKTINILEVKCRKYKKLSDELKVKAQNVLEMSQKYIDTRFSPSSIPSPIWIVLTSSSFNMSQTSQKQICETSVSKIPCKLSCDMHFSPQNGITEDKKVQGKS